MVTKLVQPIPCMRHIWHIALWLNMEPARDNGVFFFGK